eukprot:7686855-Alexandrium_andersonii.AAC.1
MKSAFGLCKVLGYKAADVLKKAGHPPQLHEGRDRSRQTDSSRPFARRCCLQIRLLEGAPL